MHRPSLITLAAALAALASCASPDRTRAASRHLDSGDVAQFQIAHAERAVVTNSGPGGILMLAEAQTPVLVAGGSSRQAPAGSTTLHVFNTSDTHTNVNVDAQGGCGVGVEATVDAPEQ